MQPIIEAHRVKVTELCRQYHVRRLEVFGSSVRQDFDLERSDVDLLVEFEPGGSLKALDQYFGLKESLESLLGRPVDLVVAGAVRNPYLLANIERDRQTLYAA
jgi:hypothetical protein